MIDKLKEYSAIFLFYVILAGFLVLLVIKNN